MHLPFLPFPPSLLPLSGPCHCHAVSRPPRHPCRGLGHCHRLLRYVRPPSPPFLSPPSCLFPPTYIPFLPFLTPSLPSLGVCPAEALRIRMVANAESFKETLAGAIEQEGGIPSLWDGFPPLLVRQVGQKSTVSLSSFLFPTPSSLAVVSPLLAGRFCFLADSTGRRG